jgi:dienelactone hydrolase
MISEVCLDGGGVPSPRELSVTNVASRAVRAPRPQLVHTLQRHSFFPSVLIFLSLCAVTVASAQTGMIGRVLEKVACTKDQSQTYALYVPSAYQPDKKWPVIFCFDPGARGLEPVRRLQAAAEKHGYIVAGSLNSRNGPWADNAVAIQAMVGDVQSHLNLDPARLYTAGLSGGARVATQLALAGLAKGVIGCSAGFPQSEEGIPRKVPFVYFGTAGAEDFNYGELRRLDDELDDRKATHRIVFFDGGHEWAPAELLGEAVLWLVLQEMRAGTRPRDDALIQSTLAARVTALPTAPAIEVWRATKSLAADFQGLADVATHERKAKELAASRDLKDTRKAERDLAKREDTLAFNLIEAATSSSAAMRKQVAAIRALADATADSPERRMARRILAGAAISARESVRTLIETDELLAAAGLLEMVVTIRPEQTRNYFELARVQALGGEKSRALATLQQAAEKGLSGVERLENEPAFAKLKSDPVWPALVEKIRANPPESDPRSRGRP